MPESSGDSGWGNFEQKQNFQKSQFEVTNLQFDSNEGLLAKAIEENRNCNLW
jgi:hypothetical protein